MRRNRILIICFVLVAACGEGAASTTTLASTTTTTLAPTTTLEATTTTQPPTTTTLPPTTTEPENLPEGSGCTPGEGPLPNGEWFGLVTARRNNSLDFDLACWFMGDAAVQASAEDGEESPPPNDYYVRNHNPATRDVPMGENVQVAFFPDGDPNNETRIDYDDWKAMVATRGYELGVWLTIEDGEISEIHEVWVP